MSRRLHLAHRRLLGAARRAGAAPDDLAHLIVGEPGRRFDTSVPSRLNNDGSPLQLCLTADARGVRPRLLGDPCAGIADPDEQSAHSRAATERVFASRAPELVPAAVRGLELFTNRGVWLAAAPHGGAAVYLDAFGPAWDASRTWLGAMLARPGAAYDAVRRLETAAVPASLALEGSRVADARVKLYVRLRRPAALSELGIELFDAPVVHRFLTLALADGEVDGEGLLLGLGFRLADGGLADVKVDVCGHCLGHDTSGWIALGERLTGVLGTASLPLAALLDGDVDVAFVGLGLDATGAKRLNVYVKAAIDDGTPTPARVLAAVEDAVDALAAAQHADGSFVDYHLPVGRSDQWLTAYVGHALAEAGTRGFETATTAARRAASWLLDNRTYAAGWGFNHATGPDADSTALALALFRRLALPQPAADVAFVAAHRRGGGFATYDRPDGWGEPHPDVTPLAYAALPQHDRRALLPELLDFLGRSRGDDGLWQSYWWRDPSYATWRVLALLADEHLGENLLAPAIRPGRLDPRNPFQLACTLGVEQLRRGPGAPRDALVRALLRLQRLSGRWDGSADLRVPDPAVPTGGRCYADSAGLIATATAVEALASTLPASPTRRRRARAAQRVPG